MSKLILRIVLLAATATGLASVSSATAQETLPWGQTQRPHVITPDAGPVGQNGGRKYGDRKYGGGPYAPPRIRDEGNPYKPPETRYGDRPNARDPYPPPRTRPDDKRRAGPPPYQPYAPAPHRTAPGRATYTTEEILDAGHRFFGTISSALAKVIEYAFSEAGRPNGYILGEEAGGAYIAGLRYGEGRLYTKDAGQHKVYWQGPSIGFDFGAEGSKTMILVYNLRRPSDLYQRFGGIDGSAYMVGGVGITFQKRDDIVLAPIRSGLGLRFGANVGYLKYSRLPTWNPF